MRALYTFILLLCLSSSLLAQNKYPDYAEDWALVDSALKKDLPRTALAQVQAIAQKAESSANAPQMIKARKTELSLRQRYRLMASDSAMTEFWVKTSGYKGLAGALTRIYRMEILLSSFQDYTNREPADSMPYLPWTWTNTQILSETNRIITSILADSNLWRSENPSDYGAVLVEIDYASNYFRNMYQVVLYEINRLIQENYQLKIITRKAAPSESNLWFVKLEELLANHTLTTDLNNLWECKLALHRLLLKEVKAEPLAVQSYFDLQRLHYFYKNAEFEKRHDWYQEALNQWSRKTIDDSSFCQVAAYRADYWYHRPYNKIEPESRWYRRMAVDIIDGALRMFPTGNASLALIDQRNNFTKPTLSVLSEDVNLPGQAIRLKAEYSNTAKVWFRIIPMPFDSAYNLSSKYGSWKQRGAYLASLKPLKEISFALPDAGDFHSHGVELYLDALPEGNYMILASDSAAFDTLSHLSSAELRVQSSMLLLLNENYARQNFVLVNATSGEPLAGVTAQKFTFRYDTATGFYKRSVFSQSKTDKNGFFQFDSTRDGNAWLLVKRGNTENYFNFYDKRKYLYDNDEEEDNYDKEELAEISASFLDPKEEEEEVYTALLTDRSIYRPGQTIYLKGIMYLEQREGRDYRILPNQKSRVYLYDPQGNEIAQKDIVSNEFGSFETSFIAPSGLPGSYTIVAYGTQTEIRIEEYKRPQFYVETEPMKAVYSLGSRVTINGKAKAYAGNSISGAKVEYKIKRQAAIWLRYYDGGFDDEVVAKGLTTTAADGSFSIPFSLEENETIKPDLKPDYRFTIEISVTDANGETRETTATITAGYRSIKVGLDLPAEIAARGDLRLKPRCTNLNEHPVPFTGSLIIEQLQMPAQPYRERKWDAPDTFVLSRERFRELFPNDPWMDDNLYEKLKMKQVMLVRDFDKDENPEVFIPSLEKWEPGLYRVVLRAEDGTLTQKEVMHFELLPADGRKPSSAKALTFLPEFEKERRFEPGQKAKIRVGSMNSNQKILYWVDEDGTLKKPRWISANNSASLQEITIREQHRGGMDVQAVMVRNGRVYQENLRINVPWSNKQLKVETVSFRDRLSPGAQETWTLKVSGVKAQAATAELCAVLYDASLDQIYPHGWSFFPWLDKTSSISVRATETGLNTFTPAIYRYLSKVGLKTPVKYRFRTFRTYEDYSGDYSGKQLGEGFASTYIIEGVKIIGNVNLPQSAMDMSLIRTKSQVATKESSPLPPPRRNFNETAFFYPLLKTDNNGELTLQFTLPESLTRWKLMALAHDKKLAIGLLEKTAESAKELMVQPNMPRFVTETDSLSISSRVVNNSAAAMQGTFYWQITSLGADTAFISGSTPFSLSKDETRAIPFAFKVPERGSKIGSQTYAGEALQIKMWAVAADAGHSDGEEHLIPVLSKKVLMHATMPVFIKGAESASFRFTEMEQVLTSKSAVPLALTVEFASNPAWSALKALPVLMEFPHHCAEQTFNRWYAALLAHKIVMSDSRVQMMIENWRKAGKNAPKSPLETNPELKDILLSETPWLKEAKSETERMARLAELFDENALKQASLNAVQLLTSMQNDDGGFPWFSGGKSNPFISFYMLSGLGRLQALGLVKTEALPFYIDLVDFSMKWLVRQRMDLIREKADLSKVKPGPEVYQAFYALSMLYEGGLKNYGDSLHRVSIDFWYDRAIQQRAGSSLMLQAMLALAAHRSGDMATAKAIIKTLREYSTKTPSMGMYWSRLSASPYWHSAPIESHAMILEAFKTIDPIPAELEAMKQWLLRHKETNSWASIKATAEACHALLGDGKSLKGSDRVLDVELGDMRINPKTDRGVEYEAGTGYFKIRITGPAVKKSMAKVDINSMPEPRLAPPEFYESIATGTLHLQYFEDATKAKSTTSGIKLTRRYFREEVQDGKIVLLEIQNDETLSVGSKIITRLSIESDRDYEFVHLKAPRAAGLEPLESLSGYRYAGELGYYLAIRDAATHCFIDRLPKGTFTIEFSERVFHSGRFVLAPPTIRSMYAPAYGAQGVGVILKAGLSKK